MEYHTRNIFYYSTYIIWVLFASYRYSDCLSYENYCHSSLHTYRHPWEVVWTTSLHGVQTRSCEQKRAGPQKFHSTGRKALQSIALREQGRSMFHLKYTKNLKYKLLQWRGSFSCSLPVSCLQTDAQDSTSLERKGVLEITFSCDGRNLSIYKMNSKHFRLSTNIFSSFWS